MPGSDDAPPGGRRLSTQCRAKTNASLERAGHVLSSYRADDPPPHCVGDRTDANDVPAPDAKPLMTHHGDIAATEAGGIERFDVERADVRTTTWKAGRPDRNDRKATISDLYHDKGTTATSDHIASRNRIMTCVHRGSPKIEEKIEHGTRPPFERAVDTG